MRFCFGAIPLTLLAAGVAIAAEPAKKPTVINPLPTAQDWRIWRNCRIGAGCGIPRSAIRTRR
jgi:hypothetical protein